MGQDFALGRPDQALAFFSSWEGLLHRDRRDEALQKWVRMTVFPVLPGEAHGCALPREAVGLLQGCLRASGFILTPGALGEATGPQVLRVSEGEGREGFLEATSATATCGLALVKTGKPHSVSFSTLGCFVCPW